MMFEKPDELNIESSTTSQGVETFDLHFKKKEIKPNVVAYDFEYVSVGVDTSGKNYVDVPELVFGNFDKEKGKYSIDQPKAVSEVTTMEYVAECIKVVSQDSGIKEFWFYPYGEDGTNEARRESARLRLFRRYLNFVPAPTGHGYILKI